MERMLLYLLTSYSVLVAPISCIMRPMLSRETRDLRQDAKSGEFLIRCSQHNYFQLVFIFMASRHNQDETSSAVLELLAS